MSLNQIINDNSGLSAANWKNLKVNNLSIGGSTEINILTVNGPTNLNNSLSVDGTTQLNSSLIVDGTSQLNSSLIVDGVTELNSFLNVDGPTELTNSLTVDGASQLNSSLTVDGASQLNSSLTVDGASQLNSSLTVDGASQLNSSLTVDGLTQINNNLTVNADITSNSLLLTSPSTPLSVYGEYAITGTTTGFYVTTINATMIRVNNLITIKLPPLQVDLNTATVNGNNVFNINFTGQPDYIPPSVISNFTWLRISFNALTLAEQDIASGQISGNTIMLYSELDIGSTFGAPGPSANWWGYNGELFIHYFI